MLQIVLLAANMSANYPCSSRVHDITELVVGSLNLFVSSYQLLNLLITARKRSLEQGNMFTGMHQSFCPGGGVYA